MNLSKAICCRTMPFLVLLCLPHRMHATALDGASLQWTKSAPFPEPRSDYAAGALDGKLVIAGGTYWDGTKGNWVLKRFSRSVHAFDPVTQVWEKLPDLPVPLCCAASTVVANKLFVLGGFDGFQVSSKIYTLEKTSTGYAWSYFGELPTSRVFAAAVSVGRWLYLLGGTNTLELLDAKGTCCATRTATDSFTTIDTAHPEKGWSQLPALPGPTRTFFTTSTDGKSIWVFGGRFKAGPDNPDTNFDQVFRYGISEARWQGVKSLPRTSASAPTPVLIDDKIVLISDSNTVWQLDLKSLQYRELTPLPEAVSVDKFVLLKNLIVGAGGENAIEGPRRRSESTFVGLFVGK